MAKSIFQEVADGHRKGYGFFPPTPEPEKTKEDKPPLRSIGRGNAATTRQEQREGGRGYNPALADYLLKEKAPQAAPKQEPTKAPAPRAAPARPAPVAKRITPVSPRGRYGFSSEDTESAARTPPPAAPRPATATRTAVAVKPRPTQPTQAIAVKKTVTPLTEVTRPRRVTPQVETGGAEGMGLAAKAASKPTPVAETERPRRAVTGEGAFGKSILGAVQQAYRKRTT